MNTLLLSIILIPIIEIYLFIKIGSQIGAFKTIFLIFFTAVVGVFYAKHEGLNTIKSGLTNMIRNQIPAYELISGAAIAFAAILLIIPGFATDVLGFLLIFWFLVDFGVPSGSLKLLGVFGFLMVPYGSLKLLGVFWVP